MGGLQVADMCLQHHARLTKLRRAATVPKGARLYRSVRSCRRCALRWQSGGLGGCVAGMEVAQVWLAVGTVRHARRSARYAGAGATPHRWAWCRKRRRRSPRRVRSKRTGQRLLNGTTGVLVRLPRWRGGVLPGGCGTPTGCSLAGMPAFTTIVSANNWIQFQPNPSINL